MVTCKKITIQYFRKSFFKEKIINIVCADPTHCSKDLNWSACYLQSCKHISPGMQNCHGTCFNQCWTECPKTDSKCDISVSTVLEIFEKIMRFKWLPCRNCLLIIVWNHYLLSKSIRKMIILFLLFWHQEIYLCKPANANWFY